jgi:sugar lactone lactonase YvrE
LSRDCGETFSGNASLVQTMATILKRSILLTCLLLLASGIAALANPKAKLEVAAELSHSPGGMTIAPNGSIILSLNQFQKTTERVVEIKPDGEVQSFPSPELSRGEPGTVGLALDAVLGLCTDKKGVVWMLDNGRRSETLPKLVAWDSRENKLVKVIYLPPPATVSSSFLNDLVLDPEEPYLYITDPADGNNSAIVVVNLVTGHARRVLEGHFSVKEAPNDLLIDGVKVEVQRPDGKIVRPLMGANPIAIDKKGDWLYFGSMSGRSLYRINTRHLRDEKLTAVELNSRVEGYSEKPICDSIVIDSKGNIFVSDIGNKAIGMISEKDRKYEIYVRHDQFLWPDGLCFGNDGRLYFYASQLNCTPHFNKGKDCTVPPFLIFKIKVPSGFPGF